MSRIDDLKDDILDLIEAKGFDVLVTGDLVDFLQNDVKPKVDYEALEASTAIVAENPYYPASPVYFVHHPAGDHRTWWGTDGIAYHSIDAIIEHGFTNLRPYTFKES